MPELEVASTFSSLDLARLVTRGYEGYPLPVVMDAPSLEAFMRERDVDLARSVVAFEDGRPIGLAFVSRRGAAGYLAMLAVVPEARGRGTSRVVFGAALANLAAAGATSCTLEVLDVNERARRLYAGFAFQQTRTLGCWRSRGLVGRNLDVKETTLAAVRARARPDAPWPNALATAAHAQARGYASHAGYAVARPTTRGLVVYDVGGDDPGAVLDGLGALYPGEPATHLNVVDPRVEEALARRGWERFAVQLEMRRALP